MLKILFPSEEKNFKIFLASRFPPDLPTVFGTNQTFFPTPPFAQILPNMQYFPNHWSMEIFFTAGIGPDIMMNVFEDYTIFLICTAWVLFNFYFKQKQRFFKSGVWLRMPPLSPSMKEFGINNKNTLIKCRFLLGNFKYNKAVSFIVYSLQ